MKKETLEENIWYTISFGWMIQGMRESFMELESAKKANELLHKLIKADRDTLIKQLEGKKLKHYSSCYIYIPDVGNCSCGADQFNKGIDDAISLIQES